MKIATKRMKMPSRHFPGANLRIEKHTQYEFRCVSCDETLLAPLNWVIEGTANNEVDADVLAAIDFHFGCSLDKIPHSQRHNIVQCRNCASVYIVYLRVEETSMCAYRATISSVIQILNR